MGGSRTSVSLSAKWASDSYPAYLTGLLGVMKDITLSSHTFVFEMQPLPPIPQLSFITMRRGCEADADSCPLSQSPSDAATLADSSKYHLAAYYYMAQTFNE